MAKDDAPRFFCTSCGNEFLKWEGRCPACGDWNSMAETPAGEGGSSRSRKSGRAPSRRDRPGRRPTRLGDVSAAASDRRRLGIGELDLVLGGGLVPGSLLLLGGAPGIGKSTLLLQVAARIQRDGGRTLYVSGEESADQVRMRAERVEGGAEDVSFLTATDVDRVVDVAEEESPDLLCVDSVQTLATADLDSSAGSVSQVRECAARLQDYAKGTDTATFLVGHVTKGGGLAGPKTLEHVVDVVLTFEGEKSLEHRLLRALKNRFGSVDELAAFRMTPGGLDPVDDPTELFLADRPTRVSGSAVAVPLHGSRPLLTEVQALTGPSQYPSPQRVATGFPSRRLAMLLTVLERRAGLSLSDSDVYVNVVGGLTLSDPAADLAVAAAVVSSRLDRPLPADLAFLGEVGLGGEIRSVRQGERRLSEVKRAGLAGAAVPVSLAEGRSGGRGLEVRGLRHVGDLRSVLEEAGGAEEGAAASAGVGR